MAESQAARVKLKSLKGQWFPRRKDAAGNWGPGAVRGCRAGHWVTPQTCPLRSAQAHCPRWHPLLPATPIYPHVLLLLQTAEQASGRVLETVNFGRQAKKEQWLWKSVHKIKEESERAAVTESLKEKVLGEVRLSSAEGPSCMWVKEESSPVSGHELVWPSKPQSGGLWTRRTGSSGQARPLLSEVPHSLWWTDGCLVVEVQWFLLPNIRTGCFPLLLTLTFPLDPSRAHPLISLT